MRHLTKSSFKKNMGMQNQRIITLMDKILALRKNAKGSSEWGKVIKC